MSEQGTLTEKRADCHWKSSYLQWKFIKASSNKRMSDQRKTGHKFIENFL